MSTLAILRTWSARRWVTALIAGSLVALVVALPTAVIPNPIFGRDIAVTWWSYPVVILSGILGGMLIATYVREPGNEDIYKAARVGSVGGLLAFFAVGCRSATSSFSSPSARPEQLPGSLPSNRLSPSPRC